MFFFSTYQFFHPLKIITTTGFFPYKFLSFFFCILNCNAMWLESLDCRRISVPFGIPISINLPEKISLEMVLIRNVGRDDVNFCIDSPRGKNYICEIVTNNTITKIDNTMISSLFMSTQNIIRFDNYKNESAIIYVTIWYQQYMGNMLSATENLVSVPLIFKNQITTYYRKLDMCETPIIDNQFSTTLYKNDTTHFDVTRNHPTAKINLTFDFITKINAIFETFWPNDIQQTYTSSLFETIMNNLIMYFDKKIIESLNSALKLDLEVIKQKLKVLRLNWNKNCNISMSDLNSIKQEELKHRCSNAMIQYKILIYYLSDQNVFLILKNYKKTHYFLELIYAIINLQMNIYDIGLMQINVIEKNSTEEPVFLRNPDLSLSQDIKIFMKNSIKNYNNFVQDLIDNLYSYAYEDSLGDENIYNAVARAHNHILEYGVIPLHFLIEKFLIPRNIEVDFSITDFTRPYLYFSQLIGVPTLESAIRASTIIKDLYNEDIHIIFRSVRQMTVQLNINNDIVGIVNNDGQNNSVIDIKMALMDFSRHNDKKKIKINIPMTQYIAKVEICMERMEDKWLTKVGTLKIQKTDGNWINIGSSYKKNLTCQTYEKKGHSIYRITIFSDVCRNDGAGVSVALVYKKLDGYNDLMVPIEIMD